MCRIPLLAVSLASICLGFLKLGDCADEPWIPAGVAVHGILMLLDVALAAAALGSLMFVPPVRNGKHWIDRKQLHQFCGKERSGPRDSAVGGFRLY